MTARAAQAGLITPDDLRVEHAAQTRAGDDALRVVAPALVGRAGELELLVSTLSAPPAVVVIEGEAGIGKTRLVAELAAHPDLAGRRFVAGGCRLIREPFPLGPILEALRGVGADVAALPLSPVAGALRPLLPELGDVLPPEPAPLEDAAAERHRVFRGLVEVLAALGPAVLVLEDLHWADEQTVEFIGYLLGEPAPRLSLVVTYRGEEVDASLRAVTAKLPAAVRRVEVVLRPFDTQQTGTLAAAILETDAVSEEFASFLCERTDGLPFAIEEVLAVLRERRDLVRDGGRWARRALDTLQVPTAIRDSVLERVSRLADDARSLVEAAAVLQEPSPVALLLAVSDMDPDQGIRCLDEALGSGLLVERDDTVALRHWLAAQAVDEALSRARKALLHTRAASALQSLHPTPLGRVAHHLKQAAQPEWVEAAELAADQASALGNAAQAARLLEDALRSAELGDEGCARVAAKLGRAAHENYQASPELIELLTGVLERQPPSGARGELAFWLSTAVQDTGGDPAVKRRLLTEAVESLEHGSALRAWAMLGLGIPTHPGVPLSEHRHWLGRVLDAVPEMDDPPFEVFLLGKVAMSLLMIGDPAWRELVDRMDRSTGGRPRQPREVSAYLSAGMTACYTGRHELAGRLLDQALAGAIACDSQPLERLTRSTLALLDGCRGQWTGLDERIAALLDELADVPLGRVDVEVLAGVLALARGDVRGAHDRLTEVAEQLDSMGEFDLLAMALDALARIATISGEFDEVTPRVERLLAALEGKELWSPVARVLPAATQLLVATERGDQARDLLTRVAGRLRDADVPLAHAALPRAGGILEGSDGNFPLAAELLLSAGEAYESLQQPYEAAQAREEAALALWQAGDGAAAEDAVRSALDGYERLGASWDAARATRVARRHHVSLPTPYRGGRRGFGDQLSPRERQVAEQAARGLTNKEIGDELFLSPETVRKHLGRAMRKLGVHSRRAVSERLEDPELPAAEHMPQ